jgi:mersacidin/lichenicidin family type 2 lantibiotic
MRKENIIRAWKDEEFRAQLGEAAQGIPENPAGAIEMEDFDLDRVAGGADATEHLLTAGCCGGFTTDPGYCSFFCGGGTSGCFGSGLCSNATTQASC